VSEPDAHSTCSQPHYITLKAIVKRKEYLEGQIRKLVDHVVVMVDHKRDIQFVHDLFDLHSDGLAKVERSNGGVACVTNLKRILGKK
jgi:tRNA U38,U39,U40 pseudouridine synthase TruA